MEYLVHLLQPVSKTNPGKFVILVGGSRENTPL